MRFLLNVFLHILHVMVIISSLIMCFFESLIVFHLWLQGAILSSWVILGPIIKQPGMCLITEIQKIVNRKNNIVFPNSYMIYLYHKLGFNVKDEKKINNVTFSVFTICTLISIVRFLNI